MKRALKMRLMFAMIIGCVTLVSSGISVNAASGSPTRFMSANVTDLSHFLTVGDYDFDLYNRTTGWVLNGFYTKENGKWSKNWLSTKLGVGKSVHMVWSSTSNEGDCVVPFKTTWDDYDKPEEHTLDWCKGIKSVYLKDDTFTVDYK